MKGYPLRHKDLDKRRNPQTRGGGGGHVSKSSEPVFNELFFSFSFLKLGTECEATTVSLPSLPADV